MAYRLQDEKAAGLCSDEGDAAAPSASFFRKAYTNDDVILLHPDAFSESYLNPGAATQFIKTMISRSTVPVL